MAHDCVCGCRPPRPISDTAVVAHDCAVRLERRLRQAAELWEDVDLVVARQTRIGDPTPRAGRPAPPQPIRPDADPADDDVRGWATDLPYSQWASETVESVRNTLLRWAPDLRPARYGEPPTDMADLTRWVAGRLGWARYEVFAGQLWQELHYAAGLLWQVVDLPATRTRLVVGPCPELADAGAYCTGQVVAVVPADEARPAVMRCDRCGTKWSTDQWIRAGRRILARKGAAG